MDTSGGFFFSFDAPSETTAEKDVCSSPANSLPPPSMRPPSISIARFPWITVNEATQSQWAAAYCHAGPSLSTATKPRQLKMEVPRSALASSSAPIASPTEAVTLTLCYQTSPELSTLTSVMTPARDATAATTTTEHRDVIPGRYYGGLKVWSCATLLVEYLSEHASHYGALFRRPGVTVAELGCGQGLPGLAAVCLGAPRVVFQDYNEEVLTVCTQPNLGATVAANHAALLAMSPLCGASMLQVKFVYGDWVDLKWEGREGGSAAADAYCDVALGADVTFDKEACDKLACVLRRWLRPHTGEAIIASKDYYFGTNGGYLEFTRSAASQELQVTMLTRVDTADKMPHVVLRVTHASE